MKTRRACLRTVLALILLVPPALCQCALEKMIASDGAPGDFLGNAVALQGDFAFVGAPFRDTGGVADSGAVYVFLRSAFEWQEIAILVPSESNPGQNFGFSLDVLDDRLLIGAPGDVEGGSRVGAVYVFESVAGSWSETDKLVASDPLESSGYARSVALGHDTAVVGAWGATGGGGASTGAAYVFETNGGSWQETAKLFDPLVTTDFHNFGYAVDISQDTLLVGAIFHDGAWVNSGAVYVGERVAGSWSLSTILMTDDPGQLEFFGSAVAIDHDHAVISATGTNSQLSKVYFWTRSNGIWSEVYRHRPPTKDPGEWFGYSVALQGNRAVVGARLDEGTGSAYLYRQDASGWAPDSTLFDPQGGPDQLFGQSVALDGSYLLVGGPKTSPSSGSATAFDLTAGIAMTYCLANSNSTGFPALIGFGGSFSIMENSAYLRADNCPVHQFGVFFYGDQPNQIPFGNGFLCVSAGSSGLYRLYPPLTTDRAGVALRDLDFTVPPLGSGAGMVHAGEAWYFQFWYRDPMGGGNGFNLSDGLKLILCP